MATILQNLRRGAVFTAPLLRATGVVLDANDCEIKVRILRDGTESTSYWSPHTEITPGVAEGHVVPTLASTTDGGASTANAHLHLECPKCGKVCTSKSGLTMHMKGHI